MNSQDILKSEKRSRAGHPASANSPLDGMGLNGPSTSTDRKDGALPPVPNSHRKRFPNLLRRKPASVDQAPQTVAAQDPHQPGGLVLPKSTHTEETFLDAVSENTSTPPAATTHDGDGSASVLPASSAGEDEHDQAATAVAIGAAHDKIGTLEALLAQRSGELEDLRSDLAAARASLAAQAEEHTNTVQAKDELIGRLRAKAIAAVSQAAELPNTQPFLARPEPEIIKEWQSLSYMVANFVKSYIGKASDRRVKDWAESSGHLLQKITVSYRDVAVDHKACLGLIEAAIWLKLKTMVFGTSDTQACVVWAGRYSGRLAKLSKPPQLLVLCRVAKIAALTTRLPPPGRALAECGDPSNVEQQRAFHRWKATAAGLVAVLGPVVEPEPCVLDVVEELEELLEPFRPRLPWTLFRQSLDDIVVKAVALDKVLCGQLAWYWLCYPEKGFNVPFDRKEMTVVSNSPTSSTLHVRFTVRPSLVRAGGSRGETYSEFFILDHAGVWMY